MLTGNHRDWRSIAYAPAVTAHYPGALIAELPRQASVLDVGCHDGFVSCYIARKCPAASVHGIDINPDAIVTARDRARSEGLDNVRFAVRDVLDPVPQESFDAVVTIRLLTCFPEINEWRALLHAITHRLKPRGWWYAVDYEFDERNTAYADRYAAGERAGWRRGNFRVTTLTGESLFIAHHHTAEELDLLRGMFTVSTFRRFESRSMHGNRAAMFELMGRPKESA